MFFLPIQASRRLISIKKKNKMFIFYESVTILRDSFGILQTTGSLLRGTLLKTIQNLQLSDFPTYSLHIPYIYKIYSLHIHNIYPTYTLHIASLYLDTILYLLKDKLVLFFYNLDYPTYTLRISSLCLPWTYLGPTLDLPWTYEQFLTKLFVMTPKLSIVNCLRILNFL